MESKTELPTALQICSFEQEWKLDESTFNRWEANASSLPLESPIYTSPFGDSITFKYVLSKTSEHSTQNKYELKFNLIGGNIIGQMEFQLSSSREVGRVLRKHFGNRDRDSDYFAKTMLEAYTQKAKDDSNVIWSKTFHKDLNDEDKFSDYFANIKYKITYTVPAKFNLNELAKNFNELRFNKRYSDVTLKAGGRSFPANKSILSVRSPVFERMFSENFLENQQKFVDITDIEANILEAMLDYIYTTEVTNLTELAPELLVAADKYSLESLYKLCVNSIQGNLSTDNVVQMLLLADTYNVTELKSKTMSFINQNGKDVFSTNDWKNLVKPNQKLMIELYENLMVHHHKLLSRYPGKF